MFKANKNIDYENIGDIQQVIIKEGDNVDGIYEKVGDDLVPICGFSATGASGGRVAGSRRYPKIRTHGEALNEIERLFPNKYDEILDILDELPDNYTLRKVDGQPLRLVDDTANPAKEWVEFADDKITCKGGSGVSSDKTLRNQFLNNKLLPNKVYEVDGFKYTSDAQGRVSKIEGEITYAEPPHRRDGTEQGRAKQVKNGKTDPPVDQGGHMIGARFNGPVEQINYFPQNPTLNQGVWKAMEDEWAAVSQGTNTSLGSPPIKIEIYPFFDDIRPLRPSRFEIKSWYNNVEQPLKQFNNPF